MKEARLNRHSRQILIKFNEDVWHLSKGRNINFTCIEIPWLKTALKRFMKLSLVTLAKNTTASQFRAVRLFSEFIVEEYGFLSPQEITREVIIDYLNYLVDYDYSPNTRATKLSLLKGFLDMCVTEKWANIQPYLITAKDFPRRTKTIPQFVPDEVIEQIIQNTDKLPRRIVAMLLVLMECGMRVSELCDLKKNCLSFDAEGDPFLTRYQSKNRQEHIVPISQDLAEVIKKQIEFVNQERGEDFKYLFPPIGNRAGRMNKGVSPRALRQYLAEFSIEAGLKTFDGKPYHLFPHAFRHTVATQMINKGVPIHLIQRFLGHNSPEMTIRTYAYIHDETLKEELKKFQDTKVVNISGNAVSYKSNKEEDIDLQFFKKNVLAQALPNGYCARPAIRGACPHANACLTCGDFRTTKEFLGVHKQELEKTEIVLEKARENGWERQLEMNAKVANNLKAIISTLEQDNVG